MSSHPWIPLHVPDYLADTAHLDATASGAYLHLIFHYWLTGSLPDDAKALARIAKVSPHSWNKLSPVLGKFFHDGWKHKRIDAERRKANEISEKRRVAAEQMHEQKASRSDANASANAEQKQTQQHLQQQLPKNYLSIGEASKREAWTPPRHGATSTARGRVYIERTSDEWAAYAEDYRQVHGCDPIPNRHGGRWFKTLGERTNAA